MKHETEIFDGEPLNFEAVYNRYVKFVNQHSSLQSVQRPVIMKAFEHIKVRISRVLIIFFFAMKYFKEKIDKDVYFSEFRDLDTSRKYTREIRKGISVLQIHFNITAGYGGSEKLSKSSYGSFSMGVK